MSGNTVLLGIDLAMLDFQQAAYHAALIAAFLIALLLVASPAVAQSSLEADMREAAAAYERKDMATAARLWKVWAELGKQDIQLLAQTHDSITFQFPDEGPEIERSVIEYSLGLLREITLTDPKSGRVYITPGEAKTGWNWAPSSKTNPGG